MIIRTSTEADYDLLPELEARSDKSFSHLPGFADLIGQPGITEGLGPHTRPGTELFMAETDAPIGFVYAYDLDDCCFVGQISVVPEAQGAGAGTGLLDALWHNARARGRRGITLTTFADIPWNAPFYARRGFHELEPAEMGPALAACFEKDVADWSRYGRRCAMGRFFAPDA